MKMGMGAVVGVGILTVVPAFLAWVGFTATGVTVGSIAAGLQVSNTTVGSIARDYR